MLENVGLLRFNLKSDEIAYLNLEISPKGYVKFEVYSTGTENELI